MKKTIISLVMLLVAIILISTMNDILAIFGFGLMITVFVVLLRILIKE